MNQRMFGKTNRMITEIGLGTWQLGTVWGEPFNEVEAMKILESAYDCGINMIDTADIYNDGNSELAIGKFIKKYPKHFYIVTKCGRAPLFAKYPTLEAMAAADITDVEKLVHSCGFYKHKARDIVLGCQMLLADYGGKVPGTMEELLRIPGVGRKTANLLLGDLYGVPGSVVCDTHCIRICGRLGLSQGKEPEKVERQLRAILPPEESSDFCHRIVLFGRDCCTAQRPHCHECPLTMFCKEFNP